MRPPLQNVTLPNRPRLLPGLGVYERRSDELQIGLDPRHAVVAPNLPPILMDILRGLDGRRTTASLLALARDEHAERLRDLLTGLAERGLVEEADSADSPQECEQEPELWSAGLGKRRRDTAARRARSAVLVHGGGRLAAAVASLLAAAGVGHIDTQAEGTVTRDDLGSGLLDGDVGSPRRHALTGAVRRANPATRTTRLRGNRRPDLVVVTDAVVPAPELITRLSADGLAHLPVRVRDGIGIVGPLVLPGRSSCLRCADLHRTALDACWPRVAGQLAGRYQRAELSGVYGTAALAAGQVLRFLCPEDTPPPTWNGTLELDCYAGTVLRREWPAHPHCSCGAPRPSSAPRRSTVGSPAR
ncbi:dinucleotide-utilizing enzyme possibly involved in molybdopterin or thiamin biosynthesis [Saccharomonospora marina XMU15]|uniref:Dinucleotide-utilizing enzyme possibly involved in molybdopterin or thiamin biosynthesis n=1 Tax=Saccharomonospora marina XMU15 TaxID=882083 RepID=H5XBC2_9PSEU|nr:ThiF family adenylyltransferase [Saccharomonospora marina]EHR49357.1 dinucleotide-utilizing enzyme possibly involved in molybdopterin or thiamin biosynthesis [Saccharomonospora marina XMU15]